MPDFIGLMAKGQVRENALWKNQYSTDAILQAPTVGSQKRGWILKCQLVGGDQNSPCSHRMLKSQRQATMNQPTI